MSRPFKIVKNCAFILLYFILFSYSFILLFYFFFFWGGGLVGKNGLFEKWANIAQYTVFVRTTKTKNKTETKTKTETKINS